MNLFSNAENITVRTCAKCVTNLKSNLRKWSCWILPNYFQIVIAKLLVFETRYNLEDHLFLWLGNTMATTNQSAQHKNWR